MAKELVKKLGLMVLGAGLVAVTSYGPKYNINGSKVKDGYTIFNSLVEYKGEDKIRYVAKPLSQGLDKVVINGEGHNKKDTLIYPEAEKRYYSLLNKIDSIKTAKHDLKIQKKLEKEREKVNEALEILKK
jgi:hypothetical protein